VRHHINALSNLYARARSEGWVATGYDPVGDLLDKPTGEPDEPVWLEVPEAALFLVAAKRCPAGPAANGQPPVSFGYELIATFLLSGGRQDEVLGLEVSDIDFKRDTLTFRPNEWRRLKTAKSHRTVPLWPQLKAILRPYVMGKDGPKGRLLFPSNRGQDERMLTDVRKLLDRVAERAGTLYVMDAGRKIKAEPGTIRTRCFRNSYVTARLQTLDRGEPVSVWTVAREVGHNSTSMIEKAYGQLGTGTCRVETADYGAVHPPKVGGIPQRAGGRSGPNTPRSARNCRSSAVLALGTSISNRSNVAIHFARSVI
jgi:integrase